MTRQATIAKWLDFMLAKNSAATPWIQALEVGRIRMADETKGHSTLHIATHPGVARLVSIDITPKTEGVTREVVPAEACERVEFVNADSVEWMAAAVGDGHAPFDFIYLDGLNDAQHVLAELELSLGLAREGTIIILDDTDGRFARKGDLAVPYAKAHPRFFEIVDDIPADKTCQGMLVVQVKKNGST